MAKPGVPALLVLALACGAQLMVVLDGLIVTVALPQLQVGLDLSPSASSWIVNGYLISFGGFLLLAARAADLYGHRRTFLVGVVVFTLASLAGGLAQDGTTLLCARIVQGTGAAALAPSSLSLLTMSHTGEQRARALSIWSATSASAGALGLVLGGVVTSGLGWRWVLLVNVPIGVALWVLAWRTLRPSRALGRQRLDLPGAVTATLGVAALTYGISQVGEHGWASGRVLGGLVSAAAMLWTFVVIEQRAPAPLLPLSLLRGRNLRVANTTIGALGGIMTATMYFLSLYQQRVLGNSPLQTGLALVPMSAVLAVGAIASKRLLPRFGTRTLIVVGASAMTTGLIWLSTITAHSNYVVHVLGPTLVWAAGASIMTMPCVALATADIAVEHAGIASGLVNTARTTGGAVGLAALATVANAATAHSGSIDIADRTVHGYSVALVLAGIVAAVTALLVPLIRSESQQPAPR